MTECHNSKIHISSNFLLSKSLIIMSDTLLLVPSLHCNTSQHFATLHHTTIGFKGRNPVKDAWLFTVQVLFMTRSGLSAKRVNP